MDNRIKVLFYGDAVTETGFSRVLKSIADNLPQEKYKISWIGINYHGDPHDWGYKIYPAGLKGDFMGLNRLKEVMEIEEPDLLFILTDIWAIDNLLEELSKQYTEKNFPKIVTYFPVDSKDHDPTWYKLLHLTVPVVYNQYGKTVAEKARPDLNYRIISHGIDSNVFKKISMPKSELRNVSITGSEHALDNSFIVLNGNRNQPRKRLDLTMRGYSIFLQNNKGADTKLYMHCGKKDASIDVPLLAKRYGLGENIILSNTNGPQQLALDGLNLVYNFCDAGINTSLGEGFGLVNVEHAITGAPQIVPNHSACRELFKDCGLLIPIAQDFVQDRIQTTGGLVSPEDVAEKIDMLYRNKSLYERLSKASLEKFTREEFSWKYIANQWDELFSEVVNGIIVS